MSRTFSLVCHETKQSLWIGQSCQGEPGMAIFYSGMPEVMDRLGRFLIATQGKPLCATCDGWTDYEEFEETEMDFE